MRHLQRAKRLHRLLEQDGELLRAFHQLGNRGAISLAVQDQGKDVPAVGVVGQLGVLGIDQTRQRRARPDRCADRARAPADTECARQDARETGNREGHGRAVGLQRHRAHDSAAGAQGDGRRGRCAGQVQRIARQGDLQHRGQPHIAPEAAVIAGARVAEGGVAIALDLPVEVAAKPVQHVEGV